MSPAFRKIATHVDTPISVPAGGSHGDPQAARERALGAGRGHRDEYYDMRTRRLKGLVDTGWTASAGGGHFIPWEVPNVWVGDLRTTFRGRT